MDKIEALKRAVLNLNYFDGKAYVSDPKNWCIVHATQYMPLKNKDGTMYIPSTAMATNFEIPRSTVHTTFNHIVTGHIMGSWDNTPIVVLAPYTDIVEKNGNPAQIAAVDTYWSVNPERGFILPKTAYVVKPSNDVLFNIGEHGATYKRDNYNEEEIQTILGLLKPTDREEYEKYQNGDFKDYEIEHEFLVDKRVKKMYESAKDKKAFLRGLFEESKFDILSHYLRDVVVNMSMDKIGFKEVRSFGDGTPLSEVVAETATKMGIEATASNKGHSNSLHAEMEHVGARMLNALNGGFEKYGIFNAPDLNYLLNYLVDKIDKNSTIKSVTESIIKNEPIDFAKRYEDAFISSIHTKIITMESNIKYLNKEILDVQKYQISDEDKEQRIKEILELRQGNFEYIKKLSSIKTIADYDKNLSEVLHRNGALLSTKYNDWLTNLTKHPGYERFVKDLQNAIALKSMSKDNERF